MNIDTFEVTAAEKLARVVQCLYYKESIDTKLIARVIQCLYHEESSDTINALFNIEVPAEVFLNSELFQQIKQKVHATTTQKYPEIYVTAAICKIRAFLIHGIDAHVKRCLETASQTEELLVSWNTLSNVYSNFFYLADRIKFNNLYENILSFQQFNYPVKTT